MVELPDSTERFELRRHFSLATLAGIVTILLVLATVYSHIASRQLIEQQTRANVILTRVMASVLWPQYAGFVRATQGMHREELINRSEVGFLYRDVTRRIAGTEVTRVKIYSLDGTTVFSTDPTQIGMDISGDSDFIAASNGHASSSIIFRDEVHTYEKVMRDRNLISSYVPIRNPQNGEIEGVFEVYADVTGLVENIRSTRWLLVAVTVVALGLLYIYLLGIIRRADTILKVQSGARRAQEERIRWLAFYDPLTELGNRAHFQRKFDEVIKRSRRAAQVFAVMLIDLDDFKPINDSFGHDAGDRLLQLSARRIRECIRETDSAFRLGGDEFVVLLENLHDYEDAMKVARKVLFRLYQPANFGTFDVRPSASIGMATYPGDGDSCEALLKHADIALYQAKEAGRNCIRSFSAASRGDVA